ncbi:ABC transporter substrate-binding protein [Desulfobacter vibrioformis]|uniref:ABC transporter substrate-binding protein n=1 Tax=Desulfobacter vibrioformis TaxID=34031 RepID=UPI000553E935|nr:ABC transporter substrate-binding protein [Desulfobacter vibrioformis]
MKVYTKPNVIFIATAVFIWWCGFSSAGQITDMHGRKVEVPDEIHTVYGTSPPVTYMLYAIAPELIAGLNIPCREKEKQYLPARLQTLPVVGGWFGQGRTPSLETLMQVNPDVVLAWYIKDSPACRKTEEMLIPMGFSLLYISLDKLENYPETFRFLGRLLHREKRAAALADYAQQTLDKIKAVRESIPESDQVSVYYAEGMDGLSTECDTSVHAELLGLCGGKNVHICPSRTIYGKEKVSIEQVMRYAPDVIVSEEYGFYDAIFQDPRWRNIPAVQNHRVYQIPNSSLNWLDRPPSFMRFLGARWLLNKLYPEKYDVDIVDETRRFYSLFLNFKLDRQAAEDMIERKSLK